MPSALSKLVQVGGSALSPSLPSVEGWGKSIPSQLLSLLSLKNGFYAFESALHVFPSLPSGMQVDGRSAEEWNTPSLWRERFSELDPGYFFFAEDVFGDQFFISEDGIGVFRAETGEVEEVASSLESWAEVVLADFDLWAGYPIAHEWQKVNGELKAGMRLTPKIPFVVGGGYELCNLYAAEASKIMLFRADFSAQIRDLPDGATVKISVIE
ncbi:SMI1/KNR4 family protein [Allokutzneria oryzae]|uniref:SMI1/KNR4 family protein n=1 Tax=Allokutzneria oryzae TaxID=1378989 RepID=A0ABV5ZSA7_9PSEU